MSKLEQEWLSIKKEVMCPQASKEQISDMRMAFYAGATGLLNIILDEKVQVTPEALEDAAKSIVIYSQETI